MGWFNQSAVREREPILFLSVIPHIHQTHTQDQQTDRFKQPLHRDGGLLITHTMSLQVYYQCVISAVLVRIFESQKDAQMEHRINRNCLCVCSDSSSSDFRGVTLVNPQSLAVVWTIRCAAAPLSINKPWGAY